MTEHALHTAYLLQIWSRSSALMSGTIAIAIRPEPPGAATVELEQRLLQGPSGGPRESGSIEGAVLGTYGAFSRAERAMVERWGMPCLPAEVLERRIFLGRDLNGGRFSEWRDSLPAEARASCVLVFLDQILNHAWLAAFPRRIINAHSAVLPFARGMNAVEQITRRRDPTLVEEATGATIHYVDSGVDTGAIIHARRLDSPWAAASVWDLKGQCYLQAFTLLAECGHACLVSGSLPGARPVPGDSRGPVFRAREFDQAAQRDSEDAFAFMKSARTQAPVPSSEQLRARRQPLLETRLETLAVKLAARRWPNLREQ